MYVIVAGAGKVGWNLARELLEKDNEVTVIEASRSSGSRMLPRSSNSASRWRISSPTRNWRWL